MRRFEFQLLIAVAFLPVTVNAQQPIAPTQAPVAAVPTVESEDVVPAAELEEALQELEAVHAQNYQTLAGLAEQAPEAAQPAIKRAMENSQRGWQRARDNRQRAQARRQAKMQQGKGGKPTWAGQGGRQGYRPTQIQGQGGRPEQTGKAAGSESSVQGQSGLNQSGQQPRTANRFQPQSRQSDQQFRSQGGSQQQRGQSTSRGKSRR